MYSAKAYAAFTSSTPLAPHTVQRRDPGPRDVRIDILYCGVCHSDIHQVRNEWHNTTYPCVPGHEIVGRVTAVGREVTGFKEGDLAAVGCMVDSCRQCPSCREGYEQFCAEGAIFTYNGPDKISGGVTYGGYSDSVVVDAAFVLPLSVGLDPAAAAPLLCAGVTTWAPLRRFGVGPGQKVGVIGLGGLGHMAVKFARAFGADVVLFTTSPGKTADALRLGAHEVVISRNSDEMNRHAGSFDFILDTVSAQHDLNTYLALLKRDGTLCLVGAPEQPLPVAAFSLIFGHHRLAGSLIGGIEETRRMLEFCAEHRITSDIELIPMSRINEAHERILKSDVKYRFVIDMKAPVG
ncbi:MAG: NAD(P)-dependent alcohol dehydrogenase [Rhodospirillaceae bacterium]